MTAPIRRGVTLVQARLRAAVDTLRSRPAHSAALIAAFLGRWALRIGLPLAGAAAMLTLLPYRATAGGAHFHIQGSLLTRHSLSADTSFGSWTFPHVDGLPIGAHITPVNVDLVQIASQAAADPQGYAERLRADLVAQLPAIIAWMVGEVIVGALLGLAAAAAINLALRQLRGLPRREHELRHRLRQLGAAAGAFVIIAAFGALTYNADWPRQSRVSGTLATLQLFPGQLTSYYNQRAKALDVLSAVAAIQSGLQQHIDQADVPDTAFNIMFISDMHLASTYPLVKQYATNFDVKLIINTGDEAEFGTRPEMTASYLDQLREVTRVAPMIWSAGNHDSPATADIMRSVPGVTVLGTKTRSTDGNGYQVGAQQLAAYGLRIGALPDPRVYGGPGDYGAEDDAHVNSLEQQTADAAASGMPKDSSFDIFATHEPVTVAELVKKVGDQIRQTNSGHTHMENAQSDIQKNGAPINLIEGSTGAGGLDQLNRGLPPSPTAFSIESVASSCQFTKVVRFQISGAAPNSARDVAPGAPPQVTASTQYLKAQDVTGRVCGTTLGVGQPTDL
jgi:predicted MPP superfamily phosphohydrolase